MLGKIREYWNQYGMEILVLSSLVFIFICFVYNYSTGSQGTYSQRQINFDQDWSMRFGNKINQYKISDRPGKMSKLERKAKEILENYFGLPFEKIRPDFLKNPVTGNNLEIDLYNEQLGLGVEVNGDQHYKFTPFFQKNKEAFMNQRYRDEIKKYKCESAGIILIEIPYSVGEKGIYSYLINQLRINGFA